MFRLCEGQDKAFEEGRGCRKFDGYKSRQASSIGVRALDYGRGRPWEEPALTHIFARSSGDQTVAKYEISALQDLVILVYTCGAQLRLPC